MKLVILESYVLREGDLDWSEVRALRPDMEVTTYARTEQAQVAARIGDAELVIVNKCRINEDVLAQCPNLQWVGIIATGTDNLDLAACRRHGVSVANVPGYSTYSVAQFTFSLLLAVCQCAERENRAVQDGYWQLEVPARYGLLPQIELYGKTFGIYGYGSIGRQAGRIAQALGMQVLACTRTVRPEYAADGVEFVSFEQLLARSDVLSLHCPATPATRGLISAEALRQVKPSCILLNTARGALVDEAAVAAALREGRLGFYAADAFVTEPIEQTNPLLGLPNALLTPHIAWTTTEALAKLMQITAQNLRSFLAGQGENIVN
jgi:glycerate dehydrogenase